MGMLKIWDGKDLPPEGCDVLIQLASANNGAGKWLPHKVTGYRIEADLSGSKHVHRVFIEVDCGAVSVNERLLCDVRPLHWRE